MLTYVCINRGLVCYTRGGTLCERGGWERRGEAGEEWDSHYHRDAHNGGRADGPPYRAEAMVYFSPRGGVTSAVVRALAEARVQIRVQAYLLTLPPIVDSLVA